MILATTTSTVEVLLGEAIATAQLAVSADWAEANVDTFTPGNSEVSTNGVAAVTVIAAPANGFSRSTRFLNVYNADTIAHAVVVQMNITSVLYVLWRGNLPPQKTLTWTPQLGWTLAGSDYPFTQGLDGWQNWATAWTYASATTFTISGDYSTYFSVGDKIRLTQTTAKYFYVFAVAFSAGTTTVSITGGSDYSLANAAITAPASSKLYSPTGFPNWFNYSPTFVGWTVVPIPSFFSRFMMVGNTVTVVLRDPIGSSVSNSATTTITPPLTAKTITSGWWASAGYGFNTTSSVFVMYAQIQTAGTTIVFSAGLAPGTAWPTSGTKIVGSLTLVYEV